MKLRMSVLMVVVAATACVHKGSGNVAPHEVKDIPTVENVMELLALKADPMFDIRSQGNFSQEEWAHMAKAAEIIIAAGNHLESFVGEGAYDEGFRTHAKDMAKHGQILLDATGDSLPTSASEALSMVKKTCADCHSAYR